MGHVRPYLQFARLAFQRCAVYRAANWTGVAVNFFFLLVHAQVLLAFFRAKPGALGWQPHEAVLYFTASEALLMVVGVFPNWRDNLGERVRSGAITTDLARPVTLFWREVAERYGTALYYLIARTPPVFLGGLVVYRVAPALTPELLLFPLSLALAIGVSAGIWYMASSVAYWREAAFGELSIVVYVNTVLGGIVVPLDFYPDWLRALSDALPFRAMLYTPVALLTGKLTGGALVFGLAHQIAWLALLAAASLALEKRGLRRLTVQGT